jgi:hypothetical protein
MDVRPVDTEAIVNTRNRIRLSSAASLLGVLLYFTIAPLFNGTHVSWLHIVHIVVQPIALGISIVDGSPLSSAILAVLVCMLCVDSLVLVLNFITISRCIGEPSASCFERIYEKSTWALLATLFIFTDIVTATQFSVLHSQLSDKDIHENAEKERLKVRRETPTWNSIVVFQRKSSSLNMLMLVLDVVYFLIVIAKTSETPLFWLAIGHSILDPLLMLIDTRMDKLFYSIVRAAFIITGVFDCITVLLHLQGGVETAVDVLAVFITLTYIVVDFMQIYFLTGILGTMKLYETYKQSL